MGLKGGGAGGGEKKPKSFSNCWCDLTHCLKGGMRSWECQSSLKDSICSVQQDSLLSDLISETQREGALAAAFLPDCRGLISSSTPHRWLFNDRDLQWHHQWQSFSGNTQQNSRGIFPSPSCPYQLKNLDIWKYKSFMPSNTTVTVLLVYVSDLHRTPLPWHQFFLLDKQKNHKEISVKFEN